MWDLIGRGASRARFEAKMAELKGMRKQIRSYARSQLKGMMRTEAIRIGMKIKRNGESLDIKSFDDIGGSWATDASGENSKMFFQVCHGMFDDLNEKCREENAATWPLALEQEFMQLNNLEYLIETGERSYMNERCGCIQSLISREKGGLVAAFNKRAKKAHGWSLVISRSGMKDADQPEKNRKRKKGIFDVSFVKSKYGRIESQSSYIVKSEDNQAPEEKGTLGKTEDSKPIKQTYNAPLLRTEDIGKCVSVMFEEKVKKFEKERQRKSEELDSALASLKTAGNKDREAFQEEAAEKKRAAIKKTIVRKVSTKMMEISITVNIDF